MCVEPLLRQMQQWDCWEASRTTEAVATTCILLQQTGSSDAAFATAVVSVRDMPQLDVCHNWMYATAVQW